MPVPDPDPAAEFAALLAKHPSLLEELSDPLGLDAGRQVRLVDQLVQLRRGRVYLVGQMLQLAETLLHDLEELADRHYEARLLLKEHCGGWPPVEIRDELRDARFELWATAIHDLDFDEANELPRVAWGSSGVGG